MNQIAEPPSVLAIEIDAFVEMLAMSELSFERANAAETGRPGLKKELTTTIYAVIGLASTFASEMQLDRVVRSHVNLTEKRLVDLERVERKLPKIAQTGVARSEIIDIHLYSDISDGFEYRY